MEAIFRQLAGYVQKSFSKVCVWKNACKPKSAITVRLMQAVNFDQIRFHQFQSMFLLIMPATVISEHSY